MPSLILHTLFGEDVISSMRARLGDKGLFFTRALEEDRPFFVLGCQGPDIFYHSQRLKPAALEYGSLLHRRGFGVFTAGLLQKALFSGNNSQAAYALGFLTHAALDRACHPYIVYFCGKDFHSFFERILDTLALKKLRGIEPALWDQEQALAALCENPPPALKELITAALVSAFPEKANKDRNLSKRIDNAFADCARFYGLSSPSKVKLEFSANAQVKRQFSRRAVNYMYPENIPAEIDFLNLNRAAWRYPYVCSDAPPREDTRSFLDIYSGAVPSAVDTFAPLIAPYLESGVFPENNAAEKIGNQSLSIVDENGKPCAPNMTDPLPLEKVFYEQLKLRGVE